MSGGQLALEAAVSLGGAILGAGIPMLLVGFKLASAWGGLVTRVNDLDKDSADHETRIRVIEQRRPQPAVRGR